MRIAFVAAVAATLIAVGPPEFRGCAGGGEDLPPDGAPLPGEEGCVRDEDCATASCRDVRCLAGACMEVGPIRDGDGDGRAPPPCGDDCDDTSADTFGGAPELCDGRDNDCNGAVDDGAPRRDDVFPLGVGDSTAILLPWGSGFLVTQVTPSALWGLPVALDGTIGSPVELLRLSMGGAFATVAGAAQGDGRVLIVAVTDLGNAIWVVLRRDASSGEATRAAGPASLPTPDDVRVIEAIPFGDGWAVGYDATTPFGAERLVATDLTAEPTIRVPLSSLPAPSFGLATDGTSIVVSDDAGTVAFFAADGAEIARHPLASTLPARPLASWDGSVVVAVPDGFDFVLAHLTAAGGLGSPMPAPFGDASDVVRIASVPGLVLVTRTDLLRTRVVALQGDLASPEGSPIDLGRSGENVSRLSATVSPSSVGVLGALEAGSGADLGLLLGCADGG